MPSLVPENLETVSPSKGDIQLALESSRQLAAQRWGRQSSIQIQVQVDGEESASIKVPASALRLFLHLLTEMSQGNAVTLLPTHSELTTQQAADLLNVSRPYVVKLLEEGKIPCRTVGKYRRVRFDDLMAFKRKDDETRAKVMEQLTEDAQKLGMGY